MCALSRIRPVQSLFVRKKQNCRKRTKKNKRSRERSDDSRISALLHDSVDERNGKTTKDSRKRAHPNKRDVMVGVAIANIVEVEFPIEANKPTR